MKSAREPQYESREILVNVPLDWTHPSGPKIEVFGRLLFAPKNRGKDVFLFLQGGPGFQSPRDPAELEWLGELLKSHRVLLLDQRGTGRSTKMDPDLLTRLKTDEALADYYSHFRGDSIVRDAEYIRENVLKIPRWLLLGQSYGGFLAFTYLSFFPQSLKGVLVTGGVPPFTAGSAAATYRTLAGVVHRRNQEFYKDYPQDAETVKRIIDLLRERPYDLHDGGFLTTDRFRYVGLTLLGSTRNVHLLHHFLEDPFTDSSKRKLSFEFARSCAGRMMDFEAHPIYALLHESIYCDGSASRWAAARALEEHGGFGLDAPKPCFYGETILPSLFEDCGMLKPFQGAAHLLAEKRDWGKLWDREKLAANPVPVECLVYKTDYYVDHGLSMAGVEATRGARAVVWPTEQHDSLRKAGKKVISTLLPRLLRRAR